MRQIFYSTAIFLFVFFVYFAVGTQYTFKPKWAIDYFNPMAKSLLQGHLYVQSPLQTYDLINYKGKWYMPWGILPAIFLIPPQIILGRFIPTFYITIFFASLNVILFYLLVKRIKKEFFPELSYISILLVTILFSFGTTQFYVGTLGSVWHVSQMIASFFASAGIFFIFKKKRFLKDYFLSSVFFSATLLCRPSTVVLLILPLSLLILPLAKKDKTYTQTFYKELLFIAMPFLIGISWYLFYNYVRFGSIFQTGYDFIHESPYLSAIRETNGVSSIKNIPNNLWYMFFELPNFTFSQKGIHLNFNLSGNSIFFLTPPFLAIFLATPIKKIGNKLLIDFYVSSLWLTVIIGFLPILMHYSSGWMQFGYRYSLEITPILLLLTIFGLKGKLNILYVLGIIFAIFIHILGIHELM